MLTKANAVGYAILALIINKLSDDEFKQLNIEPYLNGRESGFAVMFNSAFRYSNKLCDRKLVFSEGRNGGIYIYESVSWGFGMNGNSLTEEIYRDRVAFEDNMIVQVCDHIVDRIREQKPQD